MLETLYSSNGACVIIYYDTTYDMVRIVSYADIEEGKMEVLSSSTPCGLYGGLGQDEFVEEYREALKKYWSYVTDVNDFVEHSISKEIEAFKQSEMYINYEEAE